MFSKIGSPTALADEKLLKKLENAAAKFKRRVYVPCGAFWGASRFFQIKLNKFSNQSY